MAVTSRSTPAATYSWTTRASASAKQDGGGVRLYGDGNFFFRDGRITAEAGQDGGNILSRHANTRTQRAPTFRNAICRQGGYILITADGFLPSMETSITASSNLALRDGRDSHARHRRRQRVGHLPEALVSETSTSPSAAPSACPVTSAASSSMAKAVSRSGPPKLHSITPLQRIRITLRLSKNPEGRASESSVWPSGLEMDALILTHLEFQRP